MLYENMPYLILTTDMSAYGELDQHLLKDQIFCRNKSFHSFNNLSYLLLK